MLKERIEKTESAVKAAGNISADQKAELLGLLARLKSALEKVEHRPSSPGFGPRSDAGKEKAERTRSSLAWFKAVRGRILSVSSGTGPARHRLFDCAGQHGALKHLLGASVRLVKKESS
jgi:hypothetical protein